MKSGALVNSAQSPGLTNVNGALEWRAHFQTAAEQRPLTGGMNAKMAGTPDCCPGCVRCDLYRLPSLSHLRLAVENLHSHP
jgi:hypothetical protein